MVVPVDRSTLNPSVECEFSSAWLLVRAIEEILKKLNVLDKRPSQKLSAVLRLFRSGNQLLFFLGRTFGYAVEGCKLE